MGKVYVFDHPLIQHKLSYIRDKSTGTKEFRELVDEVSMLMAYEITREMPLKEIEIETPVMTCKTSVIAGKKSWTRADSSRWSWYGRWYGEADSGRKGWSCWSVS